MAQDDTSSNDAIAVGMHQRQDNESLAVENERLKRELFELRRRVSTMEEQDYARYRVPLPSMETQRSPQRKKKKKKNSLLLELPPLLDKNHRNTKDHQSVSTTDERETIEPNMDIEAHQSAYGLHHRSANGVLKQTATMSTISTNRTPVTEPMTDDEISSSEEDDPLSEGRGLIRGNLRNKQANDGILRVVESTNTASATNETDPSHRQLSFCQHLSDRAGWLIGLLVFQSLSSFILARNEKLLQQHTVIVQFLTMLVGAGGNAGNQASVGVVRGIAIGSVNRANARRVLAREFMMGAALSLILGTAGMLRAKVFAVPWWETLAITTSLFLIVVISVILGASLPLGMEALGIDPAHSSTTIQVIMDITGVVITVHVSSFLLDSEYREWIDNKFSG